MEDCRPEFKKNFTWFFIKHSIQVFFLVNFIFIVVEYIGSKYFNEFGLLEHSSIFIVSSFLFFVLLYKPLFNMTKRYMLKLKKYQEDAAELSKFAQVVDQSADLVMITDKAGMIEYVNTAYVQISGYTVEEMKNNTPRLLRSGEESNEFYKKLWTTILSGNVFQCILKNKTKDGSFFYEEKTITPIKLDSDDITHFISTGKNITDKVQAEQALKKSEALFKTLAENVLTGISTYQTTFTYVNHAFEEMTGYTQDELIHMNPIDLIHPEDRPLMLERIKQRTALNSEEAEHYSDIRIVRKNGDIRWVYVTGTTMTCCGDVSGLKTIVDITKIKELEQELARIAITDQLTTLYNRTYFNDIVKREIAEFDRFNRPMSIIIFDIDFFKHVNDEFGHDTGDKVLKEISRIGKESLRINDIFFRWGGEEFLILSPNTDKEEAFQIANRLRENIETHHFFGPGKITISGGVSEYISGESIEETIKRADQSLYLVKKNGRNNIMIG